MADHDEITSPFPPPPLLSLKTCIIRPYHPNDAESLAKHGNNPRIAQWMTNMFPHPYTIEKSHSWIAMNLPKPDTSKTTTLPDPAAQQPFSTPPTAVPATAELPVAWPATLHYAICVDGECVGSIGLKPGVDVHVRSAEVGYWLGEAVWGRGVASEATAAFVDWVFENVPHLERLGGCVYSGNGASERVLRKVGFKKEGTSRKAVWKSGVWYDLEMYGLLREEWVERKQATSSERKS